MEMGWAAGERLTADWQTGEQEAWSTGKKLALSWETRTQGKLYSRIIKLEA